MSAYKTEEEVKQQVINQMGADLGSLYHALWKELLWLNIKWREYVELFGTNPSRIEVLDRAAGRFFIVVEITLWEDTLLHIARLTDSSETGSKKNLTIQKLPSLIREDGFKKELSKLNDVAVKKADFCKDWRNRYIAHRDLELAMQKGVILLKSASRSQVQEVLDSLSNVLNALSDHYLINPTEFNDRGEPGDAVSLLEILYDGLQAEDERNERIKNGIYREEDYRSRDL